MRTSAFLTLLIVAACGVDDGHVKFASRKSGDSTVDPVTATGRRDRTQTPETAGAVTPGTRRPTVDTIPWPPVQWTADTVRVALEESGLGPAQVLGTIHQPFMRAPAMVIAVPGATLQVFIYGDAAARGRDTDRLDTVRVAPPNTMVTWKEPASLLMNNNLAVVVLTRDAAVRHRIRDALEERHSGLR